MTVQVMVDGVPLTAAEGTVLTAVLVGARRWHLRRHVITGEPRGPLCGMGSCFECEVTVDGQSDIRACLTAVQDGMTVQTGAQQVGA